MDLINILPSKRNTTVRVNGNTYSIDGDGFCRNVAQDDAAKLLQNIEAWREWNGKPIPTAKAVKPLPKLGLIGADGSILAEPTPPVAEPASVLDTVSLESVAKAETPETKWGIPGEGEHWPDPVEEMPLTYLQAMAEAYDVKFKRKTTKKDLVKAIMVEMYPKS